MALGDVPAHGFGLIQKITLTADGVIDFTGIPAGYTNLRLVTTVRANVAATFSNVWAKPNNDGAGNYWYQVLQASSSATVIGAPGAASTQGVLCGFCTGTTVSAADYATAETLFFRYADTSCTTLAHGEGGIIASVNSIFRSHAALWNSTAAVNRLKLYSDATDQWKAGSVASLYGE